MKATKETYMAAVKFASLQGYDFVRYAAVYKNFVAYYVTSKALEDSCSGYPQYVLVDCDTLSCQYRPIAEAMEILDLEK